jgi:hypothetical protein
MKRIAIVSLVVLIFSHVSQAEEILRGSIFPLPGLIETADSGPFIEVLKEIQKCLPKDVKVESKLYPPARAVGTIMGAHPTADFAFPAIANPLKDVESPFYYATPYGKVAFVLYSKKEKILTRQKLLSYKGVSKENFPYTIETFPNVLSYFPFPVQPFTCVECALKKLSLGRLDGYIMAMDEVDAEIRKDHMTTLHRELYEELDATINISKTPRGIKVKKILDEATTCALKKGRIQELYKLVHKPYEDWQP